MPKQTPELRNPQAEALPPQPDPTPAPESPEKQETKVETEIKVSNLNINSPVCESTSSQGKELKDHVLTHTEEKPFFDLAEPLKDKPDNNDMLIGEKPLPSPKADSKIEKKTI